MHCSCGADHKTTCVLSRTSEDDDEYFKGDMTDFQAIQVPAEAFHSITGWEVKGKVLRGFASQLKWRDNNKTWGYRKEQATTWWIGGGEYVSFVGGVSGEEVWGWNWFN
mmetsp:Transcript_13659/g.42304  ORF Transcript_13659/g.42304 Transcript_13659/m.42304 type:complete len:109 (-) Transcript_13659:41-367(-)